MVNLLIKYVLIYMNEFNLLIKCHFDNEKSWYICCMNGFDWLSNIKPLDTHLDGYVLEFILVSQSKSIVQLILKKEYKYRF